MGTGHNRFPSGSKLQPNSTDTALTQPHTTPHAPTHTHKSHHTDTQINTTNPSYTAYQLPTPVAKHSTYETPKRESCHQPQHLPQSNARRLDLLQRHSPPLPVSTASEKKCTLIFTSNKGSLVRFAKQGKNLTYSDRTFRAPFCRIY